MDPRVIIIQTTPYSPNYSSRSLDSYFHFWDRNCVKQFFSRNLKPQRGHCSELFQITDSELLHCWLHRCADIGTIYKFDDLAELEFNSFIEENGLVANSYRIGRKHTPLIEIARGILWKKRYWCNSKFLTWLDNYNPEVVFFNFTNNLFFMYNVSK